jgi:ATP-dependent RNA helicase RhlE
MSFDRFPIDPKCIQLLHAQGITEPTPVQAAAMEPALAGRDLIAVAQTGTGKTLAFALPALTRLAKDTPDRNRMLVLAPTRELASQVHKGIEPLARALGMRSACIYGGVGMGAQVDALRRGVDIIVATPGRLIDHLDRGTVRLNQLQILVLDEADRMLDMGFMPAIRKILGGLPKARQTMMFSATFPDEISRLTKEFQRDAHRIEIGRIARPADAVAQQLYAVGSDAKIGLLAQLLEAPEVSSAIVFIRTKHRTDRIARQLTAQGIPAAAIHGGRSQGQRERALDGFRKGTYRVLVATDVAARGIDIQGVSHVYNFDIPGGYDDYVHRIGRTGRASATGHAVTFASPEEVKELRDIEQGLGHVIPRMDWHGAVHVVSLFGTNGRAQGPARAQGRAGGQGRPQAHGSRGGHAAPRQGQGAKAAPRGGREDRPREDRPARDGARAQSSNFRGARKRTDRRDVA